MIKKLIYLTERKSININEFLIYAVWVFYILFIQKNYKVSIKKIILIVKS